MQRVNISIYTEAATASSICMAVYMRRDLPEAAPVHPAVQSLPAFPIDQAGSFFSQDLGAPALN